MNSVEFLKSKLNKLHESCPYLNIKYEYRSYINTHIIDVRPRESFENDKDYVLFQISLEDEFVELFYDEEILFITEDNKLITVETPILNIEAERIDEIEVYGHEDVYFEEIFFDDLVVSSETYYRSLDENEFVEIEDINIKEVQIKHPPPFFKWFFKTKQNSNSKLEFFLFKFTTWQKQKKHHLVLNNLEFQNSVTNHLKRVNQN